MARQPDVPVARRVSEGDFSLQAVVCPAGDDLVVVVSGGQRPHVGCVVVAYAHPPTADPPDRTVTSSVLATPPHREETLARPLAERLARALGGTVVVAAGVHDDNLSQDGIATYLRLGERLGNDLLHALQP
ncbi:MAG: hypothetical protein ACHQQS_08350 [Thermoanaerobaculales bacterium]